MRTIDVTIWYARMSLMVLSLAHVLYSIMVYDKHRDMCDLMNDVTSTVSFINFAGSVCHLHIYVDNIILINVLKYLGYVQ